MLSNTETKVRLTMIDDDSREVESAAYSLSIEPADLMKALKELGVTEYWWGIPTNWSHYELYWHGIVRIKATYSDKEMITNLLESFSK